MSNDFTKLMSEKSNSELIEIVTILRKDYQEAAIQAAINELKKRGQWNRHLEPFQHTPTIDGVKEEDTYDPKKVWKIARNALILFGIIHFFLEVIFNSSNVFKSSPIAPVFFNYLISSWWIKSKTKGLKITNPFKYALMVSFVVFLIRLLLGLIFILFFNSQLDKYGFSSQNGWDKKSESEIYNQISEANDSLGIYGENSRKLSDCFLVKIKKKYPNGLNGISEQSVSSSTQTFYSECLKELGIFWTKQTEKNIFDQMYNAEGLKALSVEQKRIIANCFLSKLKEKYPTGFENLEEEIAIEIGNECRLELTN